MKKISICIVFVFCLSACNRYTGVTANAWQGADTPGHHSAGFTNLTGKQKFRMDLKGEGRGYVAYNVEKGSGYLKMLVSSGNKVLVEEQVDQRVSNELALPSNQSYTVTFSGNNASGRFDIQYGIK
ncbi:hypothetical protein A8C56_11200 [Niabella ginsenosidivorans]|uniref:Lipoprotein n=1 Tax=Niabella ginsenosidivorans TaxID=1176587 RepID=A0A1A9I468_9BACT|nr:hypothetical protein [Niabella ginsenosidivorans]ANH81471.1 hypothetical protein A8C56_11200 [Niabella ginsenosidivorans]